MKRPEIYNKKADPRRADLRAIKKWINNELQRLLPDDDIVIDYLVELIEADSPDIDYIDSQMAEFLGVKEGRRFCKQLWERMTGMDKENKASESDTKSTGHNEDEKKTNYNRSIGREESQEKKQVGKQEIDRENRGNQERNRDRSREKSPTRSTQQSSRNDRRLGTSRTDHGRNSLELNLNSRRLHY